MLLSVPSDYDESVFINCPFDDEYAPLSQAIAYTVMRCGFYARSALEERFSENRLTTIVRLIGTCKYGIHDLSRTELSESGLPRFNMPFELGLFVGAARLGRGYQAKKKWLVLDSNSYRYQQFISDIAGQDLAAHGDDPLRAVTLVRDWLQSVTGKQLPSGSHIFRSYQELLPNLDDICLRAKLDSQHLTFRDFTNVAFWWIETTGESGL